MNTPICDFVREYAAASPARLHMPGHKGSPLLGCEALDITEIPGADVLYHADGIIRESMDNASRLFGTARTVYSAEGSSLSIRAMLYLVCLCAAREGKRPRIAAGRNAHKVFVSAAALLNLDVSWIYPEQKEDLISCTVTPAHLERFLAACPECPTAVYLTSPDYLGNLADIPGIAAVCRKFGCLLLVDNAHGAYLRFLPENRHPIALGADMCCDSAHKTLPALTGAGYLHISPSAPSMLAEAAMDAMALFASTSPSYLILQSLDAVNALLAGSFREWLQESVPLWDALKDALRQAGFPLAGQEPLKLTILPKAYGYTGDELAEILEKQNIFSEFADPDHLVLMLPAKADAALAAQLRDALCAIPRKSPIQQTPPPLYPAEQAIRPHDALFLPAVEIPTEDAAGKIMATPSISCPPAIPVAVCGERIAQWAVDAMLYYGIEHVRVVG